MSSVASARYCSRLPTSEPGTCSHSPLPAVCRPGPFTTSSRPYARPNHSPRADRGGRHARLLGHAAPAIGISQRAPAPPLPEEEPSTLSRRAGAPGIRTNLDCADICTTTGAVLSRHTGYDANITRALLEVCRLACASCGTECEAHADMHEHCRICAEACRRCEQACADLLGSLG